MPTQLSSPACLRPQLAGQRGARVRGPRCSTRGASRSHSSSQLCVIPLRSPRGEQTRAAVPGRGELWGVPPPSRCCCQHCPCAGADPWSLRSSPRQGCERTGLSCVSSLCVCTRNGIYPLMNFAVSRPHALPRALSQPQEDPQKAKTPTPEPFDVETRKVSSDPCGDRLSTGVGTQSSFIESSNHRMIESLRLEKTSEIIKFNHQPNTTMPTKPCQ